MHDVFISYSRQDREFVRALHDSLLEAGRSDWVDWHDIPPTAEWLSEVLRGIQEANAFVFVITAHSAASDICRKELAAAARLNKRIVPLLRVDVDPGALPDPLPRLNWILCRESDDIAEAVRLLLTALDLDLEWVRAHTRLLVRAVEWSGLRRDKSLTLRGSDLDRAEQWLAAGPDKEPSPTALQAEYIIASRRAQAQRQRALLTGVSLALALTLVLAALAWYQRQQAVARRFVSIAQYLAASAERELEQGRHDERAALLGRQAYIFNQRYGGERLAQIDAALRLVLSAGHRAIELGPVPGEGELTAVAYSRTGQWLAAADNRERIHVWDTAEPTRAPRVLGHRSGAVTALAFSPSDDLLLAGAEDGDLRMWDLRAGNEVPPLRLGGTAITAVAFDGSGRSIAAGTREGRAHLVTFDGNRLTNLRSCCDLGERVAGIGFQPGSASRVVTGGGDGMVRIWDASTGRMLRALQPPRKGSIEALAINAASGQIAAGYAQRIRTGSLFEALAENADPEVRVEPGVVAVWDAAGSGLRVLKGHESSVAGLTFHGDNRLVSAGGPDGTIRLWSLGEGAAETLLEPRLQSATAVASSPIKGSVAAVDGPRRVAHVWNLRSPVGAPRQLRGHFGGVVGLAFAPGGDKLAAAATQDGTVAVWDLATGKEGFPFGERPGAGTAVAFSPDGQVFACGSLTNEGSAGIVRLWRTSEPHSVAHGLARHASAVRAIDFDPSGRFLLSAGQFDSQLEIWDLAQPMATPRRLEAQFDEVLAARFGAGGRYVAWIGSEPQVRVWDRDRSDLVPARLDCHDTTCSALAFSRASPMLAAGGTGGHVCLWDVRTLKHRALESADHVASLAIDGTDTLLAAGSATGIVRVWDLGHPGWAPRTLAGLPSRVTALAFTPDGKWLAGASDASGSPILLWPLTSVLVEAACDQPRRALTDDEWQGFVGSSVPIEATCPGP